MKKLFLIIFITQFLTMKAQEEKHFFEDKTFSAKVGYICEEVVGDDTCAGQQIYLTLKFDKEMVKITEKNISTCGEEHFISEFMYQWEINQNNEIKINSNPKEIKYRALESFTFKAENKEIIGYRENPNGGFEKIKFGIIKY